MTERAAEAERRDATRQRRSEGTERSGREPARRPRREKEDALEQAIASGRRTARAGDGDRPEAGDDDRGRRHVSRAERLQQARGNRAVASAVAAARGRRGGRTRDRHEGSRTRPSGAGPSPGHRSADTPPVGSPSKAAAQEIEVAPAPGQSDATMAAFGVRPKLRVGSSDDTYEREADAVAQAVTSGQPAPAVSVGADETARSQLDDDLVQTQSDGEASPPSPSRVARTIRRPGAGRPLSLGIRRRVEPALGASLEAVRVHAGGSAARAARHLGARAFTHGRDIFLGEGESAQDLELMAHEATHVVQQGAAADGADATTAPADVQRLLPDAAYEKLNEWAGYIPGWSVFTFVIGYNPILREDVDRTPTKLVEALLELLPVVGKPIADKLREHGILRDAFEWVKEEFERLDLSIGRVKEVLEAAWDDIASLETIVPGGEGPIDILRRHFGELYDDVKRFFDSLVDGLVDLVRDAAVGVVEGLLGDAWELIKKILGEDPLRGEQVKAKATEILEDFLLLIGKEQHLQKMREEGTLQETAQWLATRLGQFEDLLGKFGKLIDTAWEAIKPQNLPKLASNLKELARDIGNLLTDVWDFATTVAGEVLDRIKDALLGSLSNFVQNNLPGFDLLTVILGRNPFTGEGVARTPANLIKGFITLLPGGKAIYEKLAETGVVEQAGARIEKAIEQLGISWEFVVGLFVGLWESLSIEDLLDPVGAFERIVERFREPVSRLFRFISIVLRELFGVLLAAMDFPTQLVGSIITNVMQAIGAIKQDPIGFLKSLLGAVKLGFQNFFNNVLTHLVGGLADWLFRGLRDAGVEPPADLSLSSVLEFVLEVLGLSVDRLWEKLAERVGQENVDRIQGAIDKLTGIWTFVQDVRERGIAAIWEHIQSKITGLWDMVLEKAQAWVMERVVNRAMQWLASLLDPTGVMAVVNSFRAFFNAVQSAAEYLTDILAIVNDYVSTLAAVAQGELAAGAQTLEEGLANAIPIVIGFLANQFGLGNIGEKIQEIVAGIRSVVDRAIDWLLDRAEAALGSVLGALGFGGQDERLDKEADEEVDSTDHVAIAERVVDRMQEPIDDGETFESFLTAKRSQARALEERYTSLLEAGIGLSIGLDPATRDGGETVLQFTVTIAPNTERQTGSVPFREAGQDVRLEGGILYVEGRQFGVGDTIALPKGGGQRRGPHVIEAFETRSIEGRTVIMLRYRTEPTGDTGLVSAMGYGTSWYRSVRALEPLSEEQLASENAKEAWTNPETAKNVLNYRAHGVQAVNPSGKDWEHIVEQETGGAHSTENLALTDGTVNNRLAAYYTASRSYREWMDTFPQLMSDEMLRGRSMGDRVSLRELMRGRPADGQRTWKRAVYERLGLSLAWVETERGRYQVLE